MYVKSTPMMVHHCIVAYAYLLQLYYPVGACDLINLKAKKLVSSLAVSYARCASARSQKQNLLPP